jgi:exosortase/archaeosortase family protein
VLELDRSHLRLGAWVGASLSILLTVYSNQVNILVSGLGGLLSSTLGTVYPAYPFLALLLVLTALRWTDFRRVLLSERGLTSKPVIRLAGISLVFLPAGTWTLLYGSGAPSLYFAMELSACFVVLVAYGALLALNPSMWRIMLPYASLYAVGLIAPLFMLDALGGPMAEFSSYLAAGITGILGVPVAWQGVSFGFVSAGGESISAVVTPACSAVYSVSIYLALLGLMFLDMGTSVARTVKFAVVGVLLIPLLNSARIAFMIWFGFVEGSAAFWGIHDWLGYAIFLGFYLAVLVTYSRSAGPRGPSDPMPRPLQH